MNIGLALGLRLVRIVVFGLFLLAIGVAVQAQELLWAGALVIGLFVFFWLWMRAGAEKCAAVPASRAPGTDRSPSP